MANSGSVSTTKYNYNETVSMGLRCNWEIESQSIQSNTTTLLWTLESEGASGYSFYTGNISLNINSEVVYSNQDRPLVEGGGVWSVSGTVVIEHDADGTKDLTISVAAGIWTYGDVNCTGSATFELTPIARGLVHIDSGNGPVSYQLNIDNGSSWDLFNLQIDNGSIWDLFS